MKKQNSGLCIHFNPTVWGLVFLLFPIISPSKQAMQNLLGDGIGDYMMMVFRLWNIASILIVIFKMFLHKKIKYYTVFALIFCGILAISTFVHPDVDLQYVVRILGSILMLFLLSDIYYGERFKYYLCAIYYTLTIIGILASASIFLYYPHGMGSVNHYMYGLDNVSFINAFHGFAVGFIYNITIKGKLKPIFVVTYGFIAAAYLYARAGTAVAVIGIVAVFMILYKREFIKKINYIRALIICMAIFLFFVVIQDFRLIKVFLSLIGKDATLNGRTEIWEVGLRVIKDNIFIGIGITDSLVNKYLFNAGFRWTIEIGHLHNIALEIMLKGGIFALIAFITLWAANLKSMLKYKKQRVASIISIFIILSWLICIFEFRITTYSLWFLVILTYHIEDLINMIEARIYKIEDIEKIKKNPILIGE